MTAKAMGAEATGQHLVVVGASAGGIEALSILVGTLKEGFPAPILVAQHLDPRRESHLGEILARRSGIPVVTVEDRASLVPGTVHVIPPNRQVTVTDHEVTLASPPSDSRPVPCVDHVLGTAADAFGEGLIAVILTGTGSDGADGARRVKMQGGTVVIQDPDTARFPSMPASLAPTSVDIVAPIEAIGPLLEDLVRETREPSRPEEERLLTTFLDELRDRSGIDFGSYKRPTILRRLRRRIAATRSDNLRAYLRHASRDPEEYQRLTSSFLIKVTEFFRDPELFDHLRDVVLPELIAAARGQGKELRLWSAGCATGEEAYSLAILVAEALGDELDSWTVRIFATDLDGEAIRFARRGVYSATAVESLRGDLVTRHFERINGDYEVRKHIRVLTVFGQHDLAQRAPFPRIDLALCRNVLIYFTPELQRRALHLFAFALRDDGVLALGKAETTSPLPEFFALGEPRLRLFRRRGERLLVPPPRGREGVATGRVGQRSVPVGPRPASRQLPTQRAELRQRFAADKADAAMSVLPFGIVAVDRDYDIVLLNPAGRRLLGIHRAAVGQDLIHLADRLPAAGLREALDEAFAGRSRSMRVQVDLAGLADDGGSWIELTCLPGGDDASEGSASTAIVIIRDVSAQVAQEGALTHTAAEQTSAATRLAGQLEAMRDATRRLLRDNDELTLANADLRGANEELLVANDEVQAATEEVETLNEELQATNEELETLNEELQATVEELNTTNDDMEARAVELQELTVSLEEQRKTAETERARLATLIEAMRDAVLVVDAAGHTVIRNSAFARMLEGGSDDPSELPLDIDALRSRVARGEDFTLPFVSIAHDGRRRWFEAYSRPVPAEMGIGEGGILVVHDTTDVSLRRLQEEFVSIVAHELRTPLTALRGYLQMLSRRQVGEDGDGRLLPLAVEQADRLHRMVGELFDVARIDRGRLAVQLQPVALTELVAETVEIARGISDRHRIRFDPPEAEIVALADRDRMQQVLLNLLMNAIVHASDSPDVAVRLKKLRRRVEIEVEDHGPGISSDDLRGLFEPFQQGEPGGPPAGLGLGLYVAHQIVTAHDGTIDVDSAPGAGTTFIVRLPLAEGASAARPAPAAGRRGRRESTTDG